MKLINDDYRNALPVMESESVDLIIIDPPYLTTKEKWDKEEQVTPELSKELFRIAKPSCSLYVWCGIGEKSQSLIRWFPLFSEDWHFKDLITWKKQRGIGMRKGWLYTREELMWFVKDNSQFFWNTKEQYLTGVTRKRDSHRELLGQNGKPFKSKFKRISNVWDDFTEEGSDVLGIRTHFTPKPIKALDRIVRCNSDAGDVVLDCFGGSGSTAIACINTQRDFIIIEKDKDIFDNMKIRIETTLNSEI